MNAMPHRTPSVTSGHCTVIVTVAENGVTANITGRADYTVTAGEKQTFDYPGSPAEVEFTDFHAIECESCWARESDDPEKWTYVERNGWGNAAEIYDRLGLRHLQDNVDLYESDAFEDAAGRNEDTRW